MTTLRRVRVDDHLELQARTDDGEWRASDSTALGGGTFAPEWEWANAQRHLADSDHLLPFQPLSFRDFMLYEKHTVDASRGLVRRFHPGQHRVTSAYESVTGRPFPLFKPNALFHRQPMYYMSNHLTFVPTGTPIRPPAYTTALDYELEIGFVLAAPLLDATPEEALAAVGAFVLLNDFSARDVQRAEMASGFGPQKSKHFANSMSATAVTADEIAPRVAALTGTVAINGSTVSTVSSAGMRWSIGEVLAHASRSERLLPGELFGTGTLPGGSGMETGHWLRAGDTLTLTLDGIGEVEHTVIDR
ncbi:fumarylacetoacetate hydrolase family protein [Nocardia puris]|uniref:Fumarylacetoacetase-like protein n=1 Tax=Nocardia puris TaxID=208602 RepID=A0A366E562_9NOCA|nr:fumarylacetoacetate hydrolase family protein [Nocardia puris]MBF6214760.1 fumarylacetoacetate hydrolase family protein [Nocardia puris]MBF6368766.1 fumarylacetoacetate hydrolase family protein [Nocardia puris]MBF6462346.1 fumarylacetoacetate hydrolase family protein [Nocardia puris]RBO96929.1 fumarylacetoacetase-like protein [Nocardia puris]